jgi:phosphohistidine swiveling domain-containing protein
MDVLPAVRREAVGGKAAVLEELQAAGFRVPEFLVSPADLADAADRLGFPLVVRSSASAEDGQRASFAGQFCSVLNLNSLAELEQAARSCQVSLGSPGVIEYCRRQGVDPNSLRMDVIVQRMIEPELAGVAFTINPVSGADEVVIEACAGLADGLLAGQTEPLPADHPLIKQHAAAIERTALGVMRHFGAPQDVEFAVADGVVYVLQARPVTRISFAPDIGEWTNADFRDGGVSSRVCSPLMWSLYEMVWEHSLKGTLARLRLLEGDFEAARMFFGRPYWNVGAVKHCLGRLPGYVEREFDADLNVAIKYEGDGRRTPVTLRGVAGALPTVLAIRGFFGKQLREVQRYLSGGYDAIERRYDPLPADVEASFRTLVERDYFNLECCYFRTIFAASLAKLDFKMSFPDADYASLMAGLPPMRHMAPVYALRAMVARGERDAANLVREYRHHYRLGLDVLAPRWDEDRGFVEALLDNASHAPEPGRADPRALYEQSRRAALGRLTPWRRRRFRRKLDRLRELVWLREEMRDLSSRVYYLIRRHVLDIARRRHLADDVFFMSFREIFADDRSSIVRNREVYERYRRFDAPNEIGARYAYGDQAPEGDVLSGIGASPGVVRGVARVAQSVADVVNAECGAIVVCPYVDPGWTPVFDRVAGVVAETGGLLSHGAVICREYGIPAVLGVAGAARRIRDGQTIIADGNQGRVTVVD